MCDPTRFGRQLEIDPDPEARDGSSHTELVNAAVKRDSLDTTDTASRSCSRNDNC